MTRLVALATIVALLAACNGADDEEGVVVADAATWMVFTDDDTGVGFELPAEPERVVQAVQLPDGTPGQIVVYRDDDGDRALLVSVFAVPSDAVAIDGVPEGAAEGVGGELVDERPIGVAGRPGRDAEIHYDSDDDERVLFLRAVLADGVLIQAQTLGDRSERAELESLHARLVDSLDLP
ncbi:MAG: hypothetical protein ACXIVQ_15855 [Acidimicrobiales bacterium]